jgi:hypothetical protein
VLKYSGRVQLPSLYSHHECAVVQQHLNFLSSSNKHSTACNLVGPLSAAAALKANQGQ